MNLSRFVRVMVITLGGALLVASQAVQTAQATNLDAVTQFMQSGKPQAALEALEPLLKANPKDSQTRFLHGILLTELDRIPDAIKAFQSLAQDHPELPEPHNNLAVLHASQGRFDEARKSLEQAIRTNPSYSVAHENLGDLYAKLASMAYDQALRIEQASSKENGSSSVATKLQLLHEIFQPSTHLAKAAKPTKAGSAAKTKPAGAGTTTVASSTSTTPASAAKAAITTQLADWAAAWSRKDVDAYLAFYDAEFSPANGLSREDWQAQRKDRLTKPSRIEVNLDQIRIEVNADGKAQAKFRQNYQADHLKARDYKTLELVLRGTDWKILREK